MILISMVSRLYDYLVNYTKLLEQDIPLLAGSNGPVYECFASSETTCVTMASKSQISYR